MSDSWPRRWSKCNTFICAKVVAIINHIALACAQFGILGLTKKSPTLSALMWWPSTVIHELSHFLVGYVLGADPVGLSVFPEKRTPGESWQLGSVTFTRLTWWSKLPVGIAPLLLLPPLAAWLFVISMPHPQFSTPSLLYKFLAVQCIGGAWPSPTDWGHARTTVAVLIGIALLLGASYIALR